MLSYFDKISVLQLECSIAYLSYNAANFTCHSQSPICTHSATEDSFYANCSRWQPQQEVRMHNFFANKFHHLILIVIRIIFFLLIGFLCKKKWIIPIEKICRK